MDAFEVEIEVVVLALHASTGDASIPMATSTGQIRMLTMFFLWSWSEGKMKVDFRSFGVLVNGCLEEQVLGSPHVCPSIHNSWRRATQRCAAATRSLPD